MKEYIASLEKEFSLIENGFKEEEKRALTDYKSNDNEYAKNLAFLAYKSVTYQVRMYSVFLFGYLSSDEEILRFMRDEVSKDDNWRVQEVLAKAFDEFCKQTGIAALKEDPSEYVRKSVGNSLRDISKKFPELIKEELDSWDVKSKEIQQVYKLASKLIV